MIHTGDCVTVMAGMPADSVDAIVTDPPYGLEFMGKAWDSFKVNARTGNPFDASKSIGTAPEPERGNPWASERKSYGVPNRMPKCATCGKWKYNGSKPSQCSCENPVWVTDTWTYPRKYQAWCTEWGTEALRVTKPGGYLLAFGGTRTHHRLVCGLEDAGWIIRDELDWIYASGFPKGKANLKPAHEPIVLARKPGPLRPLNIEESRITGGPRTTHADGNRRTANKGPTMREGLALHDDPWPAPAGRWPSNVLLSDPELFDEPNPEVVGSGATATTGGSINGRPVTGFGGHWADERFFDGYGDTGGYSRFFIVPKADRADREPVLRGQLPEQSTGTMQDDSYKWEHDGKGNKINLATKRENSHATVKPTDLMRHLIRLVTPPGGTVLDPFLGSGSTAIAAELEGFPWIGIEKEPEYVAIAEARLNGTQRGLGLDVAAPTRRAGKSTDANNLSRDERRIRNDDRWVNQRWAKPDEEPAA